VVNWFWVHWETELLREEIVSLDFGFSDWEGCASSRLDVFVYGVVRVFEFPVVTFSVVSLVDDSGVPR
jgi:hypothetical protein